MTFSFVKKGDILGFVWRITALLNCSFKMSKLHWGGEKKQQQTRTLCAPWAQLAHWKGQWNSIAPSIPYNSKQKDAQFRGLPSETLVSNVNTDHSLSYTIWYNLSIMLNTLSFMSTSTSCKHHYPRDYEAHSWLKCRIEVPSSLRIFFPCNSIWCFLDVTGCTPALMALLTDTASQTGRFWSLTVVKYVLRSKQHNSWQLSNACIFDPRERLAQSQ